MVVYDMLPLVQCLISRYNREKMEARKCFVPTPRHGEAVGNRCSGPSELFASNDHLMEAPSSSIEQTLRPRTSAVQLLVFLDNPLDYHHRDLNLTLSLDRTGLDHPPWRPATTAHCQVRRTHRHTFDLLNSC